MASTSNIIGRKPTQVHMVTWVGIMLHGGVTPMSCEGHLKLTARLNELKTVENSL